MWVFRHIAAGLRGLFRRAAVVSEIDEELRDYRDRARREYERAGLSAEEAARAAGAEMGSLMAARDQVQTSFWEANVTAFGRDPATLGPQLSSSRSLAWCRRFGRRSGPRVWIR